jgi:hypothetical protein
LFTPYRRLLFFLGDVLVKVVALVVAVQVDPFGRKV